MYYQLQQCIPKRGGVNLIQLYCVGGTFLCAISETAAMSMTVSVGLVGDSIHTNCRDKVAINYCVHVNYHVRVH